MELNVGYLYRQNVDIRLCITVEREGVLHNNFLKYTLNLNNVCVIRVFEICHFCTVLYQNRVFSVAL